MTRSKIGWGWKEALDMAGRTFFRTLAGSFAGINIGDALWERDLGLDRVLLWAFFGAAFAAASAFASYLGTVPGTRGYAAKKDQ